MNNNLSGFAGTGWLVLTTIFAFGTGAFWMIVGWRAMRAHERIASTLDERMQG